MVTSDSKVRVACDSLIIVERRYDIEQNKLSPEKVDWDKEAIKLLTIIDPYALPEFMQALQRQINGLKCEHCGEPLENHVSHGYCAGQPLNEKDEFPIGYNPTYFEPDL